jgi:hypothetical protein
LAAGPLGRQWRPCWHATVTRSAMCMRALPGWCIISHSTPNSLLVASVASSLPQVCIFARREEVAALINETRRNPDHMSEFELHPNISASSCLEEALNGAHLIVHSIPLQASGEFLQVREGGGGGDTPQIHRSSNRFTHPASKGAHHRRHSHCVNLKVHPLGNSGDDAGARPACSREAAAHVLLQRADICKGAHARWATQREIGLLTIFCPSSPKVFQRVLIASTDSKLASRVQDMFSSEVLRVFVTDGEVKKNFKKRERLTESGLHPPGSHWRGGWWGTQECSCHRSRSH